jgi:hypothetical protein
MAHLLCITKDLFQYASTLSNYPLLSRVSLLLSSLDFRLSFAFLPDLSKAKRVLGVLSSHHVTIVSFRSLGFFPIHLSYRQLASLTISASLLYDFPYFFLQTKIVYLGLTKAESKLLEVREFIRQLERLGLAQCASKL